jgi:hypothetical protein
LIFGSECVALAQRFGISSSHSPLGISIAAIAETRLAIYERTRAEELAKLAMTACFILYLKCGSTEIHNSAYC